MRKFKLQNYDHLTFLREKKTFEAEIDETVFMLAGQSIFFRNGKHE